jgi:hypothetical protein
MHMPRGSLELRWSHAERVWPMPVCPLAWQRTRTCPHLVVVFSGRR